MQTRQNSGKKVQNYIFNFNDLIGKGNFSKVYRAYRQHTNQIFAIKIIELSSLKSKKLQQLLFQQVEILKKLNHPNVLKCYEVFTSSNHCYIITQLCNEGDLSEKLKKSVAFSQSQIESYLRDIYSGLLYLADLNIVHRDIKVANIFLHNNQAKIADFGFAKISKQKWKDINIGSPIYMSPQGFIDNIYGPKTDVWAFGLLVYELLHGQSPFCRCKTELDLKHNIVIPLNWNNLKSQLSSEIKQVILMCLEVNQEKRCRISDLIHHPYFKRIMQIHHSKGQQSEIQKLGYYGQMNYQNQETKNNYPSNINNIQMERVPQRNVNLVETYYKNNQKFLSPLNARMMSNLSPTQPNYSLDKFLNKNQKRLQKPLSTAFEKSISSNNLYHQQNAKKIIRPLTAINDMQKVTSPYSPSSPYPLTESKRIIPILISSSITFKQCVNLLHYCRLIYKYIIMVEKGGLVNETLTINTFKVYLFQCLAQISNKISNKQIIYDGDNVWIRQQKLKEVADQYTKKYSKQLGSTSLYSPPVALASVRQIAYDTFLDVDSIVSTQPIKNLIIIGHCCLVIWHSTRLLQQCNEMKNYKNFSNYKQIQMLLNRLKQEVDVDSFNNYKQRLRN